MTERDRELAREFLARQYAFPREDDLAQLLSRVRAETGWVSVKERLPEPNPAYPGFSVWVLVWSTDGSCFISSCNLAFKAWRGEEETLQNVTHWMPLPAPPADAGEEKKL